MSELEDRRARRDLAQRIEREGVVVVTHEVIASARATGDKLAAELSRLGEGCLRLADEWAEVAPEQAAQLRALLAGRDEAHDA